jgi:hypothetical protein
MLSGWHRSAIFWTQARRCLLLVFGLFGVLLLILIKVCKLQMYNAINSPSHNVKMAEYGGLFPFFTLCDRGGQSCIRVAPKRDRVPLPFQKRVFFSKTGPTAT